MKKLDESKVRYIVREKKKGTTNAVIAEQMGISKRWVQKLWARYKYTEPSRLVYPKPMGRPQKSLPGRLEESAVLSARQRTYLGTTRLRGTIEKMTGIKIPYGAIFQILRAADISKKEPKKSKRRTWIKYEREHSNSLWHTDWKLLDNGEWVICYQDDASRFVTGHGVFEHATTENSLLVLEEAIEKHGKPAAILSDRGAQFYANASEKKKKGISKFEKKLAELEIKHIVARPRHPQTNGKIERLFGELQRKLPCFEEIMQRTRDPVDLFIENYNYERPHMSLKDGEETPAEAFIRKMPKEETVIDEQSGEEYNVR